MIFEKNETKNFKRLQNVLISDKQFSPQKIEHVLKSDAFLLLANYGDFLPQNVSVKVEVESDGSYKFFVEGKCDRLKIFGSLPNDYQ